MTVTELHRPDELPWESDLLSALGRQAVPTQALLDRLGAGGHPHLSVDDVTTCLQARGDVLRVADGWVSLHALADGAVLTHVLTAEERDLGVLVADGDLDLWLRLADSGMPLAGGGDVKVRWALGTEPLPRGAAAGLAGPPGWLDAYRPGQVLTVGLQAGALVVTGLETLPTPDDLVRERGQQLCAQVMSSAAVALEEYLAEEPESGPSAFLEDAVAEALYHRPGILDEPLPPLTNVLEAAGLEVRSGLVSLPGLPPDREVDDLDDVEIRALVATHAMLVQLRAGELPDEEHTRLLLTAMRIPVVADRLADRVELEPLPEQATDALLAAASDDVRAGALLLAARSAEGRGQYETAERLLTQAAEQAPTLLPAALDAAQYAAARGDAVRADGILKRAGVPADDPLRHVLRPLLSLPDGVVSRNRPCPCGSGRKYKACCLRRLDHPLPLRAQLAQARLLVHAQRPTLFETAGRFASLVDREAFTLALDMAVFEGGVIEDYLDTRGHLLPADERALLENWVGTPLAAYEVVSVQTGRTVTLRELLSGETVVLHDRAFSADVRPLDVVQARLLSDGEKLAMFPSPLRVHRMRRAALLALMRNGYDPGELAAFWGPQPLPRLQNREGQELVFSEATYDSSDEDAWDRLREHLMEDEDDDRLVMVKELPGDELLLQGSVRRSGARWTLEANSIERLRDLQRLFCEVVPDAVHVSESTQPANDVLQTAGGRGPSSLGRAEDTGLTPEQEARLLEDHMREYEQRWLDMELPGLGGRTPRTAATEGGAALAELQAMLDDMSWLRREYPDGSGMDPDRLRGLLGLPGGRGGTLP